MEAHTPRTVSDDDTNAHILAMVPAPLCRGGSQHIPMLRGCGWHRGWPLRGWTCQDLARHNRHAETAGERGHLQRWKRPYSSVQQKCTWLSGIVSACISYPRASSTTSWGSRLHPPLFLPAYCPHPPPLPRQCWKELLSRSAPWTANGRSSTFLSMRRNTW